MSSNVPRFRIIFLRNGNFRTAKKKKNSYEL